MKTTITAALRTGAAVFLVLGLLCEDTALAQYCNSALAPGILTSIQALDIAALDITPNPAVCGAAPAGDYKVRYLIPGSPNCVYTVLVGFRTTVPRRCKDQAIPPGCTWPSPCCSGNRAWYRVWRWDYDTMSYYESWNGQTVTYPLSQPTDHCQVSTFVADASLNNLASFELQGGQILEAHYQVTGQAEDVNSAMLTTTASFAPGGIVSGDSSQVDFDLAALPSNSFVYGDLTVPLNFLRPAWRITSANNLGCRITPYPGYPWACKIAGGGGTGAGFVGPLTIECYENLQQSDLPQSPLPTGFPAGTSGSKFTQTIQVVNPLQVVFDKTPYAGMGQGSRRTHLSVTPMSVFNTLEWEIVGNSRGCFFDPPNTSSLRAGDQSGDITIRLNNYKNGELRAYFNTTVTIQPAPQISFYRPLMANNKSWAQLSDYSPFADLQWSISSRSGAADTVIDPDSGEIIVGTQTGTVTVRAADATDGYYVEATTTVYPAPSISFSCAFLVSESSPCVASIVNWHYPGSPTWAVDWAPKYDDEPPTQISSTGVITPGRMEHRHYTITERQIVVRATAPNGDVWEEEITMYLRPIILGAPTQYLLADNGGWEMQASVWPTTPAFPALAPNGWSFITTLPGVTLNSADGRMRAGNTVGSVVIQARSTAGQTVSQRIYVLPPPQVYIDKPFLIADGSSQVRVREEEPIDWHTFVQPVFGCCWHALMVLVPVSLDYAFGEIVCDDLVNTCPTWAINPNGTGARITTSGILGLITPGTTPGFATVSAITPFYNPGYAVPLQVEIRAKPVIQFTRQALPADGASHSTASVADTAIYPGTTWAISADPDDTGTTINSAGVITAGNSVGTVTIKAIASAGPYTGYQIERTIEIDEVPKIVFSKQALPADSLSQATASLSDTTLFPSVTWSISSPAGGLGATINSSSGVIEAGGQVGTITVQALAPGGYSIQNTLPIRAIPSISFDRPSIPADGTSQCTATVSDSLLFPGILWLIADTGGTGSTITPGVNGSGLITAGRVTGTIQVRAKASDNYFIERTFDIRTKPAIQFSQNSLPAGSPSTATATVTDTELFPTVTWSITTAGTDATIGSSSGIIHAGTQAGVITIQAQGPGGYTVNRDFTITGGAKVVFDVEILRGDGKSKSWSSVVPQNALSSPTWSIQGSALGCRIDQSSGQITAGTDSGQITVRATDSANATYFAEGVLRVSKTCDDDCPTGDCVGGGGLANNNSVDVTISLGYAEYGEKDVRLRIKEETPSARITSPDGLWMPELPANVVVYPAGANPIQQVKTSVMLAVVTDIISGRYRVKLYDNSAIANPAGPAPYTLVGGAVPFVTWTIENPTVGNFNIVRVTEARGTKSYVSDYTFLTPGWEMVQDGGQRKVKRVRSGNTETYQLRTAANEVKYQEINVYGTFPWGEELAQRIVGTGPNPVITRWFFNTDPAGAGYGRVNRVELPNNSWETYGYDASGRRNKVVSLFGDNSLPAVDQQNRVRTITRDDAQGVEETIVKLKNIEVSHSYRVRLTSGGEDLLREIRCQNRGVTQINASGNLVTETYSYPRGHAFAYQPHRVLNPDGTVRIYTYTISADGNSKTTTIREGAPNVDKTDVIDGVQTERVVDRGGNVTLERVTSIGGTSLLLSSKAGSNPDVLGRPRTFTYHDGSTETVSYGCCGIESLTDRQGVVTTYDYDNLKRLYTQDKAGVGSITTYNLQGKVETETRRWTDGAVMTKLLRSYQYDDAGRLSQATDLVGSSSVTISFVNGHRVFTTTYPNTSTKVETFAKDGSPIQVGGTAVHPMKYVYDVDADGEFTKEIKVRSSGEQEWVKRYVDMMGRPYKTTYPVDGVNTTSTLSTYSQTTGQLVRQEDFGEVTTLFEYNSRAELSRRAIDMNGNLKMDLDDRVEEFATSYGQYQTKIVRQKDSSIWEPSPLASIPVQNSSFESPVLADGGLASLTGWTISGANAGIWNPQNVSYPGTSVGSAPNPIDGANVAYINSPETVYQHLTTTIAADSKYTLRLLMGKRLDEEFPEPVTVALKSAENGAVLASTTVNAPASGTFALVELTYLAFAGDPTLGHRLSISISATAAGQVNIDRVEMFSQGLTKPLVSTERTTPDGRYSWSTSFGQTTSHSEDFYPALRKRIITDTTPDGASTATEFIDDRLSSVTTRDGNTPQVQLRSTSYQYYPNGLLWKEIDARNGATIHTYDTAENVASVTTPAPGYGQNVGLTTLVQTDYLNPAGRVETVTLPDNSVVIRHYHLTGELKRSEGVQSPAVDYEYDQGRLTKIHADQYFGPYFVQETIFNYDTYRGFPLSKVIVGDLYVSYEHYPSGRLKRRIWASGPTSTYTYNRAAELETIDHSDTAQSPDVRYAYTSRGQVRTVDDVTGSHDYSYNNDGRLNTETHRGGILNGLGIEHQYDSYLRLQNIVLKRSGSALFTESLGYYAGSSQLKSVSSGNYFASYQYEPNSSFIRYIRFKRDGEAGATIVTTTQVYDFVNRLRDALNTGGGAERYTATFNNLNKKQRVTRQDGSYWNYAYDDIGRIASASKYWADNSVVAGQQFAYRFDTADNRQNAAIGGDSSGNMRWAWYYQTVLNQYAFRQVPSYVDVLGTADPLATVSANSVRAERKGNYFWAQAPVDNSVASRTEAITIRGTRFDTSANRDVMTTDTRTFTLPPAMQVFHYDAMGNLKHDGVWTYSWDAENRLVSMERSGLTKLVFAYDYLGRRVQKTVQAWVAGTWQDQSTSHYVYEGLTLVAELDGNNNLKYFYLWGPDQSAVLANLAGRGALQMLWDAAASQMHFVTLDLAGNVSSLVKASDGTVSASYDYGPFGEPLIGTGSMAKACRVRYACRYQDDETGLICFSRRYYNPSLGRWLSRDPLGEAGGINLYAYAGNDPLNLYDPLGLAWFSWYEKSDSFWMQYMGRMLDPGTYWDNAVDGSSLHVANAYAQGVLMAPVKLGEMVIHPIRTAEGLIALPGLVSSGKLKCLLGLKYEEFQRASPERQSEILGELIGDAAGGWATGTGLGELLQGVRGARLLSKEGDIPLTGIDAFEVLASESSSFAQKMKAIEELGFKVFADEKLAARAEFDFAKDTFTYNPKTFTRLDLAHEWRHYRQLLDLQERGLEYSTKLKPYYETGAYRYEQRLWERIGQTPTDDYMGFHVDKLAEYQAKIRRSQLFLRHHPNYQGVFR